MKFSQSSFVYFNYSVEDAIRKVKEAGYQGIDLWGGRPHTYHVDMNKDRVEQIRGVLKETGLEVPCFIPAQFRYPTHIASPYESVRSLSVDYLRGSIDAALKLGCNKVSLCPGHSLHHQGKANAMKVLVKSSREIMDYANDKGVKIFMEPAHAFETDLLLTVAQTIDFIQTYNMDGMGVCLDTGHCHVNGESLAESLKDIHAQKIPLHVHIDDNHGSSDDHLIPGEGNIDFVPFFKALKEIGYDGFVTAELGWKYTQDPDAAIEKCLVNLKKYSK